MRLCALPVFKPKCTLGILDIWDPDPTLAWCQYVRLTTEDTLVAQQIWIWHVNQTRAVEQIWGIRPACNGLCNCCLSSTGCEPARCLMRNAFVIGPELKEVKQSGNLLSIASSILSWCWCKHSMYCSQVVTHNKSAVQLLTWGELFIVMPGKQTI